MQYFILGLVALGLALYAVQGFTRASPAVMARQIRIAGGVILLTVAAGLLLRGAAQSAIMLGLLGSWLLGWGNFFGGASATKSPGQTSRVTTDMLEIELDHDTGEITGLIRKGIFQGRRIEKLKPVEIALLWRDCQFNDPQSAQILEAYLDRMHPTWREDMARGEREMHGGPDGRMTPAEAYEILGLKAGATEEEIRRAHRELMLRFHPDRGGSTYLASKINEAKDVLLAFF